MTKNLNPLYEMNIPIGKQYSSLAKNTANAAKRSKLAGELIKARRHIKPRDWFITGTDGVRRNMGPVERNTDVIYNTLVNNNGTLRKKWF